VICWLNDGFPARPAMAGAAAMAPAATATAVMSNGRFTVHLLVALLRAPFLARTG
jgi:hypothetical protein